MPASIDYDFGADLLIPEMMWSYLQAETQEVPCEPYERNTTAYEPQCLLALEPPPFPNTLGEFPSPTTPLFHGGTSSEPAHWPLQVQETPTIPASPSTKGPQIPGASSNWLKFTAADYAKRKEKEKIKVLQRGQARTAKRLDPKNADHKELLRWFKRASLRNLFTQGSPLVRPSEVQLKWEELRAWKQTSLQLPSCIQDELNDELNRFINRLRARARLAVAEDPYYENIDRRSIQDSPMRFKSRQVDALKAGSDLEGFFTYHGAKDSWRASSLKSVAAGILLDEFYGDEVETLLLESWNGLIPVVLLVLPWAMIQADIRRFYLHGKKVLRDDSPIRLLSLEELSTIEVCRSWISREWNEVDILDELLDELRDSTCNLTGTAFPETR